jgi:hypothetical protein
MKIYKININKLENADQILRELQDYDLETLEKRKKLSREFRIPISKIITSREGNC